MNIDFSLVLVILVALSGLIWLLDVILLKPGRSARGEEIRGSRQGASAWANRQAAKAGEGARDAASGGGDKPNDEVEQEIAEATREPVVVEYAKAFFPVLVLVLVLRSFLFEPFQIPTGSMIPTLEIGDFILVNKYAYGLRLPVIGTKLVDVDEPQRGEVMVFIPPHESQYYIKRVIGLPGDTVRYEDGALYINRELVYSEPSGATTINSAFGAVPGTLYTEVIGGIEHTIQTKNRSSNNLARRNQARSMWVVPPGSFFMMGDNRDESSDSRMWGVVPEENIVGKAVAVWMHKEPGWNLPTFSRSHWIR